MTITATRLERFFSKDTTSSTGELVDIIRIAQAEGVSSGWLLEKLINQFYRLPEKKEVIVEAIERGMGVIVQPRLPEGTPEIQHLFNKAFGEHASHDKLDQLKVDLGAMRLSRDAILVEALAYHHKVYESLDDHNLDFLLDYLDLLVR